MAETKVVNGQTYYKIGDTWGKVNRDIPNQAQTTQMQTQLQQNGTVSDAYKQQFGMAATPQYNYYTPPTNYGVDSQGKPKTEQQWLNSGGLNQLMGKDSYNAFKTNNGNYLDVSNMTSKQSYAAQLMDEVSAGKRTNESAMSVLAGMGLDKYGNQALPSGYAYSPIPAAVTPTTGGAIPGAITSGANGTTTKNTTQGFAATTVNSGSSTLKGAIPPALGYGGADYNKLDAAGKSAMQANAAYAKTDAGRAAEIERALSVIKEREAAGLDTKAQYDYLNKLGFVPGSLREDATLTGEIPPMIPDAVTNVRDSSELQDIANDQNAIERQALLTAINERINSIKNASNYSNQLLKDQRVLADLAFDRNNSPFSGKTSYDRATVMRGRDIDDSARTAQITNQLNAVQEELYNFDKLAPERQRQIYNELLQLERNFGLNQGQLTGNYGGQRTLAGQAQDYSQYADQRDYGRGVYESDRDYNLQKAQQEWANNFNQAQFDWNKAQQVWENAFKTKSFEQDMKDAAAARGLQWASLNQRDKEFIADQAFREKQYNLDVAKYESSLNKPGKYDDEAELIAGLDSYKTPTEAKNFLVGEKSNLIQKFGKSYYDSIYKEYVTDKGA